MLLAFDTNTEPPFSSSSKYSEHAKSIQMLASTTLKYPKELENKRLLTHKKIIRYMFLTIIINLQNYD